MSTPAPFPLPIVIVQHIGARFAAGLVRWLDEVTDHRVVLCDEARMPEPGLVYVAPDGVHLRQVSGGALVPVEGPPRNFQQPAIDELFESAARVSGERVLAFLLTGMGSDGTDGMLELRRAGAMTVAQAPETCTIDSMPTSAINEQAAAAVLTPDQIAGLLTEHARSLGAA
jgi:two-component system chemotaxis response regulator CheB